MYCSTTSRASVRLALPYLIDKADTCILSLQSRCQVRLTFPAGPCGGRSGFSFKLYVFFINHIFTLFDMLTTLVESNLERPIRVILLRFNIRYHVGSRHA